MDGIETPWKTHTNTAQSVSIKTEFKGSTRDFIPLIIFK